MMGEQNAAKIYTIGSLKENLYAIIQIGSIEYKVEDAMKGFQVFFKILYGLNLEYPSEAAHVWIFIERFFYEMEHTVDNNSQIRTYLNEFKIFSQSQVPTAKINITCNMCPSEFDDSKEYANHYMAHREGKNTPEYICCGRIFGNVHHFIKHLTEKHQV